jgi:hypothetical protein
MELHFIFILFLLLLRSFANGTNKSRWEKYGIPNPTSLLKAKSPESIVNLSKWYHRLGNNFQQVKEAFRIAIYCRTQLEFRTNKYLPLLKRHFDFSNLTEGNLVSGLNKSVGCHKIQVSWVTRVRPVELGTPFSIDESCSYDSHALSTWKTMHLLFKFAVGISSVSKEIRATSNLLLPIMKRYFKPENGNLLHLLQKRKEPGI